MPPGHWSNPTARGLRHRIVAYLGEMDASGSIDVAVSENANNPEACPHSDAAQALWQEVDINGVRTERAREFGAVYSGESCH